MGINIKVITKTKVYIENRACFYFLKGAGNTCIFLDNLIKLKDILWIGMSFKGGDFPISKRQIKDISSFSFIKENINKGLILINKNEILISTTLPSIYAITVISCYRVFMETPNFGVTYNIISKKESKELAFMAAHMCTVVVDAISGEFSRFASYINDNHTIYSGTYCSNVVDVFNGIIPYCKNYKSLRTNGNYSGIHGMIDILISQNALNKHESKVDIVNRILDKLNEVKRPV